MNVIDSDTYAGWVLQCLGMQRNGDYLDKMEKDFGVELDLTDDETLDNIRIELEKTAFPSPIRRPQLGDMYARRIFDAVIEKAVIELGAKEHDFIYSTDGYYGTNLMYRSTIVETWDDIVKIHNKKNKRRNK